MCLFNARRGTISGSVIASSGAQITKLALDPEVYLI